MGGYVFGDRHHKGREIRQKKYLSEEMSAQGKKGGGGGEGNTLKVKRGGKEVGAKLRKGKNRFAVEKGRVKKVAQTNRSGRESPVGRV